MRRPRVLICARLAELGAEDVEADVIVARLMEMVGQTTRCTGGLAGSVVYEKIVPAVAKFAFEAHRNGKQSGERSQRWLVAVYLKYSARRWIDEV